MRLRALPDGADGGLMPVPGADAPERLPGERQSPGNRSLIRDAAEQEDGVGPTYPRSRRRQRAGHRPVTLVHTGVGRRRGDP
jgi:hypothetical protein